jgi:hypothetical protein
MEWTTLARNIDANTARAFVQAARHLIDAMLIEGRRIEQTHTPRPRDYSAATLSREAPAGGWLSDAELHETTRRFAEAVAAEKWTDGVVFALRVFALLGG